jgi:hypothetical protein
MTTITEQSNKRMIGMLLLAFALAAWTGVLFRWTMLKGPIWESANLDFIRHAHSHLMFFAWAVPAPVWVMIHRLRKIGLSDMELASLRKMWYVQLGLGISTWPFFLMYGYGTVAIGSAHIPLAAVLSGINMIGWYVLAGLYYRARRKLVDSDADQMLWFDAAWLMLIVSSLGAWGVSVVQFGGVESTRLAKGLTHFFLATFTEGWCLISALAVMQHYFRIQTGKINQYALYGILFGAPLTFPLGMSTGLLTPALFWTGRVGALLVAGGIALWLVDIIMGMNREMKRQLLSLLWLTFVAIKGLALLTAGLLPGSWWVGQHGLRILYLHITLLGVFTVALWMGISYLARRKEQWGWVIAAVLAAASVVLSLIPLSSLWPNSLTGSWVYDQVLWIAFLPAIVITGWSVTWLWNRTTTFESEKHKSTHAI